MYDLDKPKKLKRSMYAALIFSIFFVSFQILGWSELMSKGLDLQSSPSVSYLYILTGLHVIHVAVGIIFLIVSIVRSHINTQDNVKALLYFSDPLKRSRLKLLNNYWHTIDFLWVYLFLALKTTKIAMVKYFTTHKKSPLISQRGFLSLLNQLNYSVLFFSCFLCNLDFASSLLSAFAFISALCDFTLSFCVASPPF